MFALLARIQTLLRDHKYALLGAMASVLWLEKVNFKQEEGIWGQKLMSSTYLRMTGNRGDDLT